MSLCLTRASQSAWKPTKLKTSSFQHKHMKKEKTQNQVQQPRETSQLHAWSVQSQVEQGLEQPGLVGSVPVYVRRWNWMVFNVSSNSNHSAVLKFPSPMKAPDSYQHQASPLEMANCRILEMDKFSV